MSQLYDNPPKRQRGEVGAMDVDRNLIDVDNSNNQGKEKEVENQKLDLKKKRKRPLLSEKPLIEQRTVPYSLVDNLLHLKTNVTVVQLLKVF